ncbi:MAG: efflux RND transporter periplasmic adaptor subunit [Marivibrio sp.]|uniref:efflux RND transporter periplasmic adaptor subunit n=1 Tax=Marivibrio sp. TaxID=2039719 RepID=UPI0032EE30B0
MTRIIAWTAGVLIAFGLVAGPASAQGGERPAPVEVDEVVSEPLAQTAPVIGRIVARQRGVVASLSRGPVYEVLVEVGDRVREGDVLVRLAADRLEEAVNAGRAEVARQQAALGTARSQLDLAQQELERLERLQDSPAFSPARYDDKRREVATARARVGEAQAAIEAARAQVRLSEIDLTLAVIKAPFNGVVIEKHMVRGGYANVGEPAVTLLNDEDLEIEADVPARLLSGLSEGRLVSFELREGGARYDAVVRATIPEENARTRTRAVRFLPAMNGAELARDLAPGATITVRVPVGESREVVTVHKDAVLPQGGDSVFVVVDGKAQPRPVDLGEAAGTRLVVKGGLQPGEMVVTMGNERLRPGQAVSIAEPPEAAGDGAGESGEQGGADGSQSGAPSDGGGETAKSGATAG